MQMLLPLLFLLPLFLPSTCEASLMGDHVCAKIEKFQVPVTVTVSKPYKIKENYWCPKFPPRCTREKTQFKTELQIEHVTKTRLINECCKGYIEENNTCLASCAQGCGEKGVCIAPDICKCHTNFYGPSCDKIYELVTLPSAITPSTTSEIQNVSPETTSEPTTSSTATTTQTTNTTSTKITTTRTTTPMSTTTSSTSTEAPTFTTSSPTEKPITTMIHSPSLDDSGSDEREPLSQDIDADHMEAESSDTSYHVVDGPVKISTPEPSSAADDTPGVMVTSSLAPPTTAAAEEKTGVENEYSFPAVNSTLGEVMSTTSTTPDPFHPLSDQDVTPTFGSRGFTSVIVLNNHTFHAITNNPSHTSSSHHHSFLENNLTLLLVLVAVFLVTGTALTVLVCQQLIKKNKKKITPLEPTRHVPPLPTAISLAMPSSPTPTISFSTNFDSVDLQPAIYSMGTFKPTGRQPTISPELREALEATYDHPPSQSRSCRSSEGQRSLAEMWEAVMSASKEIQQQNLPAPPEEEHLYQEIPCYPRLDFHDSRC